MVTPARAGIAGPAVVTGATGRNTNHITDSFLTADRKTKRIKEDESLETRTEISHVLYYMLLCVEGPTSVHSITHTKNTSYPVESACQIEALMGPKRIL